MVPMPYALPLCQLRFSHIICRGAPPYLLSSDIAIEHSLRYITRIALFFESCRSVCAVFGARPTQTKSLFFLIPLRTTITLLVSTPTVCASMRLRDVVKLPEFRFQYL